MWKKSLTKTPNSIECPSPLGDTASSKEKNTPPFKKIHQKGVDNDEALIKMLRLAAKVGNRSLTLIDQVTCVGACVGMMAQPKNFSTSNL